MIVKSNLPSRGVPPEVVAETMADGCMSAVTFNDLASSASYNEKP